MRISRKQLHQQRTRLDRKIRKWNDVKNQVIPRKGWLRSVREALGLSSYQLARLLESDNSRVIRLEKREVEQTATLGSLQKAAKAMGCRLVYAIVPSSEDSLDELLENKAYQAAKKVVKDVSFSMELEEQGVSSEDNEQYIRELAKKMKENLAADIWGQK